MIGRNQFVLGLAKTSMLVGVFVLVFSPIAIKPPPAKAAGLAGLAGSIAVCLPFGDILGKIKNIVSPDDFVGPPAPDGTDTGGAEAANNVPVADSTVAGNTGKIKDDTGKIDTSTKGTSDHTGNDNNKECTLDSIAFALAKVVLEEMSANFIDYINNGFKTPDGHSGPFFAQDPGDYFRQLGDEVLGEYLIGAGLGFMCEPFQFQLRNALLIQYSLGQGTSVHRERGCTLTDAIGNVNNFVEGNFDDGSWLGYVEITQVPDNNPYGAFITTQLEIDDRIASETNIQDKVLGWGSGFFSQTTTGPDGKEQIVTPGDLIQTQLETHVSSDIRQLELADEFNEILGALMAQLAKQAFSKTGLSGYVKPADPSESEIAKARAEIDQRIKDAQKQSVDEAAAKQEAERQAAIDAEAAKLLEEEAQRLADEEATKKANEESQNTGGADNPGDGTIVL